MEKQEQVDKKLTPREKMGVIILIWILKVVKPVNWSHEYAEDLKALKVILDSN